MLNEVVINNIKDAVAKGDFNRKVMTNDHVVTSEERCRYILPYDNTKKRLINKIKGRIAGKIVKKITKDINQNTKILGLENLANIPQNGAIITANHFSPVDSTIVRFLIEKVFDAKKFSIVVAESNVFMPGKLGWLLKNVNTMPFTNDIRYLEDNFNPAIKEKLDDKHFILFYPEQEMWPGYTKPRPLKSGAYHYASKHNVPLISTFITMKKNNEKIEYTIHVFPLIYPDQKLTLKENKTRMMNKDFEYKKTCYEFCYEEKLDYQFSEEDLIF
jgi:hypothetical protein